MNRLREGVQIYSNIVALSECVTLSSGSIPIHSHSSGISVDIKKKSQRGYVPLEPWNILTSAEQNILQSKKIPQHSFNTVSIIKLPLKLFNFSRELQIHQIQSWNEISYLRKSQTFSNFLAEILFYLKSYLLTTDNLSCDHLFCNTVLGLKGATYNPEDNLYVGLHIDSWDGVNSNFRHKARNRLCLNLGKEARYFLFVNLTFVDILKSVSKKSSHSDYPVKLFLKSFPEYPVIRIQLQPGEGYIAPTENIIHDASTENKLFPDVILSFLGYFKVCTLQNSF